ncbi:MAG TPA: MFS transporter [Dongiaceae bacterium]|nr:MFS transporter [Dongiaceae bacterium]
MRGASRIRNPTIIMSNADRPGADPSPAATQATPHASILAPFQQRVFLALWVASLASNFGGLIQAVGASWLMTSLSPTADIVALVQASNVLPIMALSLIAGAVSDLFDRRKLMLAAQFMALIFSALLAFLTYTGAITPWSLLALTFLVGCGTALYGPAWQSAVGEVVPRRDLPAAVALNSIGFNIARSVGPAIGGFIVALLGSQAAFLINTLSYFGLLFVLLRWKRPVEERKLPPESIASAMVAGLRYVRLSPAIRSVLFRSTVFGITASAVWALMPLIARDQIGGGPSIYGLLLGAFGVGAVLGAGTSTRLRARLNAERVVELATLWFAIASLIAAFSGLLWLSMIGMVLGGAGWVLALSTFNISIQLAVPRWVVGRAVAIYQTLAFGGMALGSWLWGLAAEHVSLTFALAFAGGLLLASLLLTRAFPVPAANNENLDPQNPDYTPTIHEAVPYRAGPVVVMIEYRIDPRDAAAFAEAMRQLGRIRQRNGARRWSLNVDVAAPERWVERYESPSWLDHLRLRYRGTVSDRAAWERARAFHRGDEPPQIRRLMAQPVDLLAQLDFGGMAERATETAAITDPALPAETLQADKAGDQAKGPSGPA